ncbi:MaoC/PaaZ C-terminal domain-containing protein [Dactylosporangium sp. NPDC006015]|uniref:MaoC/PaaZ C-terminal domain-containing protein n=1 Tax=unclassified Dactylosporangium TaxID=2621675 RepID=UPI0033BE0D2C
MKPGLELPPLERLIALPDMIAYAGATWDWHRLHYDPSYLAPRGLDRPVVDGQVFGALLAEQVQDWIGTFGVLRSLTFRFKSLVYAGETVRCLGVVQAVDGRLVTIEHRVEAEGRIAVAPASSTVELR